MEALRYSDPNSVLSYKRGSDGEILAEERDEVPVNKDEGMARWRWEMEARFIRGGDDDVDYQSIDNSDEYDDHSIEAQEAEERYFDDQEAQFVSGDDAVKKSKSKELEGETGVQDF